VQSHGSPEEQFLIGDAWRPLVIETSVVTASYLLYVSWMVPLGPTFLHTDRNCSWYGYHIHVCLDCRGRWSKSPWSTVCLDDNRFLRGIVVKWACNILVGNIDSIRVFRQFNFTLNDGFTFSAFRTFTSLILNSQLYNWAIKRQDAKYLPSNSLESNYLVDQT